MSANNIKVYFAKFTSRAFTAMAFLLMLPLTLAATSIMLLTGVVTAMVGVKSGQGTS